MKSLITLIRLPNLVIIALTMYAFRYFVVKPYYSMSGTDFQMGTTAFGLMVMITMLIAVTGYLINDYHDIDIDLVNRPDRPSVDGNFNAGILKGSALALSLLSLAGMMLLSYMMGTSTPLIPLILALISVWWYAIRLKKSLVWGNLAVSFMSSLTLGMAWFFEWILLKRSGINLYETKPISKIAIGIVVFAFLLSFIREIIKDVEDMEGDSRHGCRSVPIVLGVKKTRFLLLGLCIVLLALLIIGQVFLSKMDFPMVVAWLIFAVELPMLVLILLLFRAKSKASFHRLSTLVKWIMVGGIASMAWIWINFKL
ncbi:MAG: geranylgeranylglycerol-phosphate geranylgeranyltransferase [Bacteroidales bacterium]|nr:geranylgeranylglycerol-phosphate geranylgeranyltransferase [Bacteroidales bacterium]